MIEDELHEAQRAKANAEHELKILREEIADADNRHQEMITKAGAEIHAAYEERCASFNNSLAYREKAAKDSLNQMKADAVSAVEGAFLELVVDAVEGHMRKNASGKMDVRILKNAS